jgi:hypothetical protein
VHHNRLYIIAAEFPENYFKWVSEEVIPAGGCIVLQKSEIYALSKPSTWTFGVNHDLEKNPLPEVIKAINKEEKDLSFSQIQFQTWNTDK